MGVELGKVLAKNILAQLNKPEDVVGHDSSVSDACFGLGTGLSIVGQTTGLIHYYQKHRET
jgi:glucose-6-phosphate isomerase